jgi:acyl-coenzyme A thioesterase PaaI-like protein
MDLTECIHNDLFAKHVGIRLVETKEGYAKAEMDIHEYHLNGVRMVQGGAIFTLADYAFAAASNSRGLLCIGAMTVFKGTAWAKAIPKSLTIPVDVAGRTLPNML